MVEGLETLRRLRRRRQPARTRYNHFLRRSGLPRRRHPALPRRHTGVGEGLRRSSSSRRLRASWSMRCPARRTSAPRVPTPPAAKVAARRRRRVGQRRRGLAQRRRRKPEPGSARCSCRCPTSFQLANGLTVLLQRASRACRSSSASLVVRDRQRRQSGRQARPRELHRGDARSRAPTSRSALQIADRGRAARRVAQRRRRRWTRRRRERRSLRRNVPSAAASCIADVNRHPRISGARRSSGSAPAGSASLAQQRRIAGRRWPTSRWPPRSTDRRIRTAIAELGTEASNKAITRDDMQKFWTQNFVPNNAALVVSGQITGGGASAARREGVRRLGRAGTPASAGARRARRRPAARLVIVDKPGAPQTQLRVAIDRRARADARLRGAAAS